MAKELKIVFEDDWIIVVEKPCGMLSMSAGHPEIETAYSILYDHTMDSARKPATKGIYIVHRLDRDTSGLLVFAKDEETKRALQDNWEDAVQERGYYAVLEGHIDDSEGWIESWMYEHPKSLKVHCYPFGKGDDRNRPPRKDWKFAASHCRTVRHTEKDGQKYTCVEFSLETGRKNQIRAHSQWIGHPIAGDRKYEARTNPIGRLALHARTLAFIHPWTGKTMKFRSALPKEFKLL